MSIGRFSRLRLSGCLCGFLVLAAAGAMRADPPDADEPDSSIREYLSGNGLLNRGLYELAAAEYRKFLKQHGEHEKAPVAHYGLAVCLFRMQKYDDALAELQPLAKPSTFAYAAEVSTMIGQCRLVQGQFKEAAEAFDRVVNEFGSHALACDATAGSAEAYYRASQYDECVARARSLETRWPKSPLCDRASYFRGLAEVARNEQSAAAATFEALLKKSPTGPFAERATLLLAQCRHRTGQATSAAPYYREILKNRDSAFRADALLGLATLLESEGKGAEAAPLLDELIERFPKSPLLPAAQLARGRVWFSAGQLDQAQAMFERVPADDAESGDDAAYWMAKCRLRAGEFAEAAQRLRDAARRFPKSEWQPEMAYDRAVALVQAKEDKAAARALQAFREKFPEHVMGAEALQLLAFVEHRQHEFDASGRHCREFLEKYPQHGLAATVSFVAAENEFLSGHFDAAADGFRRFVAQFPADAQRARAEFRLGMALYRLDRLAEADKALAGAAGAAGKDETLRPALLALGDIAFRRNEWKTAEQHLTEYLAGGGDVDAADDALLKLGLAQQRQSRYEEAVKTFDRLLEKFPDSPQRLQGLFERGQTLLAMKQTEQAAKAFERVLRDGPESRFASHATNHLAAMAAQKGDYSAAAERFEKVAQSTSDGESQAAALLQQAQSLMAAARYKDAQDVFERFLKKFARHARAAVARAQLAIALSRQDQFDAALRLIDQLEKRGADTLDAALRSAVAYERAWCLRQTGKEREAADVYRTLTSGDAGGDIQIHALLDLAGIEANAKRYDEAAGLLHKLLDKPRGDGLPADVREAGTYRLAVCEYELKHLESTASLLEEFNRAFPESKLAASAHYFCGEALARTNRQERAIPYFDRVVKKFAKDEVCGPSLLRLGECHATVQHWAPSERAFADYLDRFADTEQWYQAQFGLGWAQENQGRFAEAISSYRKVIDRHKGPTAARAQFQIGECLFAQNKNEDAVRELLKVDILYAYPEWSAAALFEAGRCFEKLNKPNEAREQWDRVAAQFKETKWAAMATKRLAEMPRNAVPGR